MPFDYVQATGRVGNFLFDGTFAGVYADKQHNPHIIGACDPSEVVRFGDCVIDNFALHIQVNATFDTGVVPNQYYVQLSASLSNATFPDIAGASVWVSKTTPFLSSTPLPWSY